MRPVRPVMAAPKRRVPEGARVSQESGVATAQRKGGKGAAGRKIARISG